MGNLLIRSERGIYLIASNGPRERREIVHLSLSLSLSRFIFLWITRPRRITSNSAKTINGIFGFENRE